MRDTTVFKSSGFLVYKLGSLSYNNLMNSTESGCTINKMIKTDNMSSSYCRHMAVTSGLFWFSFLDKVIITVKQKKKGWRANLHCCQSLYLKSSSKPDLEIWTEKGTPTHTIENLITEASWTGRKTRQPCATIIAFVAQATVLEWGRWKSI